MHTCMHNINHPGLGRATRVLLGAAVWFVASSTFAVGCSTANNGVAIDIDRDPPPVDPSASGSATGAPTSTPPTTGAVDPTPLPPMTEDVIMPPPQDEECGTLKCADIGWECGYLTDECGELIDCAAEGLQCASGEVCIGGVDGPTTCTAGGGGTCELCSFLPDCEGQEQPTRLTGRVITPGRTDADTGNQVGVPNALVYILQNNPDTLPEIPVGIPSGGTACDRCEDQTVQLGDVLFGAITDATGSFTIDEYVPVGQEFTLVVKAGKFRRAVKYTVPEASACKTVALPTALPDNPTRLPRSMSDGLFVTIPKIAVSTGQIDAMECVFEKMGLEHAEFANPGADGSAAARIHLYRGGSQNTPAGAYLDDATPHATELYDSLERLQSYDMIVADCEGQSYDNGYQERDLYGDFVREYVNRGGRMFASHLSFSWLVDNGDEPYNADDPIATGLGPAAEWDDDAVSAAQIQGGTGIVATGRPNASPSIDAFAAWLANEGVVLAPETSFNIVEPRSQALELGEYTEEFIYCQDEVLDEEPAEPESDAGPGPGPGPGPVNATGDCVGDAARTQQFSFNTPYGAPEEASCGRVAYSGFHVAAAEGTGDNNGAFTEAVFPQHCTGDLTDQEKVLLYMLFDLGACVGEPPEPPECTPTTCEELDASCGFQPNGCGDVLDCGPCVKPPAL